MAITKGDRRLEGVDFVFDSSGDLERIVAKVNYGLIDDSTTPPTTLQRAREEIDQLSPSEVAKRFKTLVG